MSFKKEHTFEERRLEAEKIRTKHPDRIAIICEKAKNSNLPDIDRKKYLVPPDLTMGQFVYVVRKRLQLPPEQAIFLFINGSMFPNAVPMSLVHETKVDKDGFLYITYSGENTFG